MISRSPSSDIFQVSIQVFEIECVLLLVSEVYVHFIKVIDDAVTIKKFLYRRNSSRELKVNHLAC